MSRIHEALKKAEQERAAVHSTDKAGMPLGSAAGVLQLHGAATSASVQLGAGTSTVTVGAPQNLGRDSFLALCAHPLWHMDENSNVFCHPEKNRRGAEQFRTLRSRLYRLRNAQPLQTLLVTSSTPGEGKTFVTNNLAQAIVRQRDNRAILIDGDLRC